MYIYIYTCLHKIRPASCMHAYVHMDTYMHAYIHLHAYIHMHTWIQLGANVNSRSKSAGTPLHYAALNEHEEATKTLVCMYLYTYVCMYHTYVCVYVCMYACMREPLFIMPH